MAATLFQSATYVSMEVEAASILSNVNIHNSNNNPHKRRAVDSLFSRASRVATQSSEMDDAMELTTYYSSVDAEVAEATAFDNLPEELVYLVFTFLHGRDIANGVQKVCRNWRRLALDDQLWLDLLRRAQTKPEEANKLEVGLIDNELRKPAHKSWRWLYQSRHLNIVDPKLVGAAVTVVGRHESSDYIYEGEWRDAKPNGHGRKIWKVTKADNEAREENGNNAAAANNAQQADAAAPEAVGEAAEAVVPAAAAVLQLGGGQALPKQSGAAAAAGRRVVPLPYYEGEWREGKEHGRGKRLFEENHFYIGEWKEGDREGFGFYHWPNKTFYEGEFKEGFRHGHGTYTWSERAKYIGQWQKGIEHGAGVRTWADGDRYEGDWVHGTRTGHGTYTWPNGSSYEGKWLQCAHEGYGVYQWPDGRSYRGNFSANKKHGLGEYFWPDGAVFAGQWRNGVRHGDGTMVWPDNARFAGEWAFDRRTDGRYTGPDARDVPQAVGAGWAKKYDYYFAMPMDMWEQLYLPEINRLISSRPPVALSAAPSFAAASLEAVAKGQHDLRPWGTGRS